MDRRFKYVPDEMLKMLDSGIFWIKYTHVTSDINREGIAKTKKLMAPSVAMAFDIVPFSGEYLWFTYLFRHYHVSLSAYPPKAHKWENYLTGPLVWTPEGSEGFIEELKKIKQEIEERKPNLFDFLHPEFRTDPIIAIEECIRFEKLRQRRYAWMDEPEREALKNQCHEIYVFDERMAPYVRRVTAHKFEKAEHPFMPGEINLTRYLKGMFTWRDVDETIEWISQLVGRDVPVASIDALATWDEIFPKLSVCKEHSNHFHFYEKLIEDEQVRARAVRETWEMLSEN